MANTRKTINTVPSPRPEKPVYTKKNLDRLGDHTVINVKSNIYGTLIYINHKTREKVLWRPNDKEKVQQITFAELRDMRASQIEFFSNNWISIESVATEGFEDYTPQDIYTALRVSQYYDKETSPCDFFEIFNWSPDKIIETVPKMAPAAKENLIIALNEAIKDGSVDSIRKIKAFETALNYTITNLEVE